MESYYGNKGGRDGIPLGMKKQNATIYLLADGGIFVLNSQFLGFAIYIQILLFGT